MSVEFLLSLSKFALLILRCLLILNHLFKLSICFCKALFVSPNVLFNNYSLCEYCICPIMVYCLFTLKIWDLHIQKQVANSLIRCYGTSMCWHKYPGTIELLEYLQKRGLILGVISNFDERLEAILEDTRIRFYFSFVLTSYDFGMEKPDTSIFREALRLTKERHSIDVAPQEAIHIGDSISNDYLGAKNSNWNAFLIQHNNDCVSEKKVPTKDVFRNLRDLRIHLSTLLDRDM